MTARSRLRTLVVTLAAVVGAAVALPSASLARAHGADSRQAVFIQTNDPGGNAILAFRRSDNGSLTAAGKFATGGRGATQQGAQSDPLASQDSLVFDHHRNLLYAVNAGSDSLSLFSVRGTSLDRLQTITSRGEFPSSIALSGDLVYVLNAGGDGSISGYRLDGRHLRPIPGAVRDLGLGSQNPPDFLQSPAQIGFTPNGRQLLVTGKSKGFVDVFRIRHSGVPAATPVATATGPVPFAFMFDLAGRLVLADASGSANSFDVTRFGAITPVGTSVPDHQTATCWITAARGFFYTTSTGSNALSGFSEDRAGQLSALNSSGVTATTDGGPTDIAAQPDGRVLYELNGLAGTLGIYAVHRDGSLSRIGTLAGLPEFDQAAGEVAAQGIVVT
jgi:6-phosphogluconolactonase (cycloisomerase 2 family)